MQYIQTKTVYIDRDELTEIKAIEHDIKTRFIDFKFIAANKVLDISHCIVRIYALNCKGNEIFNNLTVVDGVKGIARLELTDSLLVPGTTEYMLKITTDNGGILSSNRFNLIVHPDLMTGNEIEGTNEYKALDEALKTVGELNSMKVDIKNHDNFMRENRNKIGENKALTDRAFTDVKKTINDFKSEVSETSYYNYVSNPIFSTGSLKGWQLWGSPTTEVISDTSLSHKYSLKIKCSSPSNGVMQTISGLIYGKHYTLKVKVWVESGTPGIMIKNDSTWNGALFNSSQGFNKWVDLKLEFWAREGTTPIYIGTVNNDSLNASFWVSEIMLHEGYGDVPFMDNIKELYSEHFQIDKDGMVFGDGNGTYSHTNDKGELEYVTGGTYNKYVALTYIGGITIPAGNPGKAYFKLPKEFTKRKNSLKWGVVPSGYYYNTTGSFFPYHINVGKDGEAYEQDGLMVLPVQGYCKIQNSSNSGDSQNISINATIFAFA